MISVEQWRVSIGLWDSPVKQGQKRKNPESLKQKYLSQTTSPIHSIWFADVNNCPKLLRLKSLSMVGQMIVFFCVAVFLWTPNMYCSIHRNKQRVFMGGQQFSNEVPFTLNFNSQSMAFYVKQFFHPYFSGSRIKLKENAFATTQYIGSSCHAVVISLRQTKVNENYELRSEGKSLLLQDLGIFKTINESVIKFKLLAISVNVERNPGPEFTKVICGSFSQGNNPKFGNMAGKQCCAIALYSLAFSIVKDVSYWKRDTLDSISEHGTALYEKIGKDGFLIVEDLPHEVEIFNVPVSVEFKFNSRGLLNREHFNLENMKQMIFANSKYDEAKLNTGFLLILSEVTVSVIIKRQLFSPDTLKLAVLDSHGRDKDGRISSDGMSVLMFFDNVSSFIHYVSQTYLDTHNSEYLLPYQIQFVHCSSSMTEKTRKRIVRLHRSSSFLLSAKMKRIECRVNESKEQQSTSLAHKSDSAGHVIVTTGLRSIHFPRPGIFLRWNSNLQQVDFSQGLASNNILGLVVLAVNDGFLHLHV